MSCRFRIVEGYVFCKTRQTCWRLPLFRQNAAVLPTKAYITSGLLILIAAFIGIVVWVFGRKRKARFAKDARIPLEDGKD